jgi:hypothetical protein
MRSHSVAVTRQPATASFPPEETPDVEKILLRPNNVMLEAFTVRLAWGFASAVLLLIALSLMLVVAGYAGSMFAPEPKTLSSSSGR